jgi:hypothetical protein
VTKPNHPWTNGQVERMNRTHYECHEQLRTHLRLFLHAYNRARKLKTLPTAFENTGAKLVPA